MHTKEQYKILLEEIYISVKACNDNGEPKIAKLYCDPIKDLIAEGKDLGYSTKKYERLFKKEGVKF